MTDFAESWRAAGGAVAEPAAATREQLLRVHDAQHVDRLDGLRGRSVSLDPDTFTSPESIEIASLAAGAAVLAVADVMAGRRRAALVLARPPGHHAERDRAMGFCLFNSIAVAAAAARAAGAARVAIVDYDVHHGNGTQHIFERHPDVLYVSMHQYPFYPGTGAATEIGLGEGVGATVNIPLESGATDDDYRVVFHDVVIPVLDQFAPDLLLISAGFDAHQDDPLGNMRLSTDAFAAMTRELLAVAHRAAGGRVVAVVEGGYDLAALGDGLRAVAGVLSAGKNATATWPAVSARSTRGADGVALTRRALSGFWKLTG